jgi:hypothetical protein
MHFETKLLVLPQPLFEKPRLVYSSTRNSLVSICKINGHSELPTIPVSADGGLLLALRDRLPLGQEGKHMP